MIGIMIEHGLITIRMEELFMVMMMEKDTQIGTILMEI